MERITLEQVKQAYAATGTKPIPCIFFPTAENDRHCCALGAIMEQKYADTTKLDRFNIARALFGSLYVRGFMSGFDGCTEPADPENTDEWMVGFRDGAAIARDIQPLEGGIL